MSAPLARDETRTRILAVALALFAERGFAATSTREMAERLGFTKAALYYHFRTKDDLLEALVQPALDEMEALLDGIAPRPSPAARRELIRRFIELMGAHEDVIRVLSEDPSVKDRPPLARAEPIFERFIRLLTGEESPGTAARTRALAALGGIQTALVNAGPDDDREIVREAAYLAACGALGLPASRKTTAAS